MFENLSTILSLLRLAAFGWTWFTQVRHSPAMKPARSSTIRAGNRSIVPLERIEGTILLIRGQRVMLDADLAALYGVATKVLVQAVKRNRRRFPADFMFQLSKAEFDPLIGQRGTSGLRSQIVTSKSDRRGGRRYAPFAFTEQGVAMLSSVLRSDRAIRVNVEIMRAFVRLRSILASHADLARKLDALERKYDSQFRIVFDAIRELMEPPPEPERPPIGFASEGTGRKKARARMR